MMKLTIAFLLAVALASIASAGTETCFLKGEKIDGLNKICYYRAPSGTVAITIHSYELCPITIQR